MQDAYSRPCMVLAMIPQPRATAENGRSSELTEPLGG